MDATIIKPTTPLVPFLKAGPTWWVAMDGTLWYLACEGDAPPTLIWTEEELANIVKTNVDNRCSK